MRWHGLFRSPRAPLLALLLVMSSIGCGGSGGDVGPSPTPSGISVSSQSGQTGAAGTALALLARVTSSSGGGMEGQIVTFQVAANSGSVSPGTVSTNADGMASSTWTLGSVVGPNIDTVLVSVAGLQPVSLLATVTPASVASLDDVSGDAQVGRSGQPLAQPLVVVARDRFGNATPNVAVKWTILSGGGIVPMSTSTTGADGQTSTTWTLGASEPNAVRATVDGLNDSQVTFIATIELPPGGGPSLCATIAGAAVVANDGQYLGRLTNEFDAESIYNQFGTYGSEFSATSIYNRFGTYGSEFSALSPFNRFTTTPPQLVKDGTSIAYFTINEFLSPAVTPAAAETCAF